MTRKSETIVLNDVIFVDREYAATGHPAFVRTRNELRLYDSDGTHVGSVNAWGVLTGVTSTPDGPWYSYATPKILGEYDYLRQREEIRALATHVCWAGREPRFRFT